MHISKLKIQNFRVIENLELTLNKGLNVLIGENNSGKTAIIDLLRLVFEESNYPRESYWKESDFRVDLKYDKLKPIEVDIIFDLDSEDNSIFEKEVAWFSELHFVEYDNNIESHKLGLHFRIELLEINSFKRIKRKVWGGLDEENKVSWNVLQALNSVYLSPLRDVNRDFRPNNKNLLGKLFNNTLIADNLDDDKKSKEDIADNIENNFSANDDWNELVDRGKQNVMVHLNEMSFNNSQDIEITFSSFEFEDIIKKLLVKIPINSDMSDDKNVKYLDIYQNGLGYNNLIYAATTFGDILQRKTLFEENYTLFLIEEPEAHLHPQLESTFFTYLNNLVSKDFQLIVSSHSSNITAKTNLENVIVLNNNENNISAISIKNTLLKPEDYKFLKKFLDVTKSQLFFAKGVILVEGVTEALLIPCFAKLMGERYNLEKNGIEVVITGTSFLHYAGLFKSNDANERLNINCATLTDGDEHKNGGKLCNRIKNLNKAEQGNFKVFYSKNTFECELFECNENNGIIDKVFDSVHERIRKSAGDSWGSKIFLKKLESNKTKSEFAYKLLEYLDENPESDFVIPNYIQKAIKFVIGELND